jgi:NADH-quinone oxidoreductase subunit M
VEDFPFLTVAICVPLAGAAIAGVVSRTQAELARRVALLASLVTLAVVLVAAAEFNPDKHARYQLVEKHEWRPVRAGCRRRRVRHGAADRRADADSPARVVA